MEIFYLGDFRNEHCTEQYVAQSLMQLGEKVMKVQENNYNLEQLQRMTEGFDLLFFAKGRIKDGVNGLEKLLKTFQGKTAFWLFDTMYGCEYEPEREEWMDRIGPLADNAFLTDGSENAVENYKKTGINYHILRQGVMQGLKFKGRQNKKYKGFQAGFVGSVYYPYRKMMLKFIADNFSLIIKGKNNMYEIRGRELADFCSTVPIILGDNYENLDNKWSNRIYNILGAGGFLITPNVEGLEEEFEEGKHFIGYKPGNLSELKDKINLFLTKPKERKKIARAGYKHVWKNYTYLKRCKILLETIKGDSAQFTQHK